MRIAMIAYTDYELDPRVRRAARALVERGHRVDFFAVSDRRVPVYRDGLFRLYRLRMRSEQGPAGRYAFEYGVFFAWALARVSLAHLRGGYDLVYAHNMPNFLVFAGLLPRLSGAGIVLDVHDPAAELLASIRGRDLPLWLERAVRAEERVSLSFADAVITVNEAMRRRLCARYRGPVAVVMNLPDPEIFVAPPRPEPGPDWLVYSGTISHRSGADLAVKALSLLGDEFPDLRLRMIGDGPAAGPVRRLAGDLGVAGRVEFLGLVPNARIPALLSGAAAGISPQRGDVFGSLVFSMKAAEYIAAGLPVICSGIPVMRHYFHDDELLFFEPGDACDLARAIREVLSDPALAMKRAARSRARLDQLDWATQKETLLRTVETSAGRPAPAWTTRR